MTSTQEMVNTTNVASLRTILVRNISPSLFVVHDDKL